MCVTSLIGILPAALFDFDFFEPLPIQIEVSDAPLTSDAGLLPLRQFDERIGLTQQLAAVLDDPRDPERTELPPPWFCWMRCIRCIRCIRSIRCRAWPGG
jgi:hypothetical protein